MIAFPSGARVWIAGGVTDMRCGMNSLALKVQQGLGRDPHGGEIFCFRGRRGDLIKVLWHDGVGMSLYRVMRIRLKAKGHSASPRSALSLLARIQKHTAHADTRSFHGLSKTTPKQLDLFDALNLPKPA